MLVLYMAYPISISPESGVAIRAADTGKISIDHVPEPDYLP